MDETMFLDKKVLKGQRFRQNGILDIEMFIKPTKTFM